MGLRVEVDVVLMLGLLGYRAAQRETGFVLILAHLGWPVTQAIVGIKNSTHVRG